MKERKKGHHFLFVFCSLCVLSHGFLFFIGFAQNAKRPRSACRLPPALLSRAGCWVAAGWDLMFFIGEGFVCSVMC